MDYQYDRQTLATYKSARGLSIAIIILLSIHAALSAILVAAWPTITKIIRDDYSPDGIWDALCAIAVGLTAVLQWGVFIACAVCFLCWLYRSYANLPALGSQSILFSPKSAVVGWFIPFVNLVQGYKSVNTLYVESQTRGDVSPSGFYIPKSAPIIGFWWAAYLARGIVSRISDKMLDRNYDGALGWLITAELLDIVAAILCIVIVYRIEKRQRDQHDDLVRRQAAVQPPSADRLR